MATPQMNFQDRLGLSYTVFAASTSLVCVTGILLYVPYKWLRTSVLKRHDASDSIIFLNLMFADLIQALGAMPNIKWVNDGTVTEGKLCTTQAVLKQIGINGVSFTSLAITVYTFVVLVLYINPSRRSSLLAILGVWFCTGLIVIIPNAVHSARHETYYGNTGFWCWILPDFGVERLVTEYIWIWITAFFMLVLYSIMFVVMRGWIIIDNGIHWYGAYNRPNVAAQATPADQEARATAKILLFYPGVYIFCFLPNTISRWMTFTHHNPPTAFILFSNTIFALSGFFNFIVFFVTRRAMVVGAQVTGPDGDELLPVNPPPGGFLPPGFPETYEREPPVFPAFDRQSSPQSHTSSLHTRHFGTTRSLPTFDNRQPSLQNHISPLHTGQYGTSRPHLDDMEEGPGFLP